MSKDEDQFFFLLPLFFLSFTSLFFFVVVLLSLFIFFLFLLLPLPLPYLLFLPLPFSSFTLSFSLPPRHPRPRLQHGRHETEPQRGLPPPILHEGPPQSYQGVLHSQRNGARRNRPFWRILLQPPVHAHGGCGGGGGGGVLRQLQRPCGPPVSLPLPQGSRLGALCMCVCMFMSMCICVYVFVYLRVRSCFHCVFVFLVFLYPYRFSNRISPHTFLEVALCAFLPHLSPRPQVPNCLNPDRPCELVGYMMDGFPVYSYCDVDGVRLTSCYKYVLQDFITINPFFLFSFLLFMLYFIRFIL